MTLQAKLDAKRVDLETKLDSPECLGVLQRAIDELVASGAARRALRAGDVAPRFSLPDTAGRLVSSQSFLNRGPLVISFYRGVWCPYCNIEMQALQAALGEIRARGAFLIAISPQTAANNRKSQRDNEIAFPILSDPGGEIADAFGLRWIAPDYLRQVHKNLGADLTTFNGDETWSLPMPARYLIGQDGLIAYAEVNPDYRLRPDPADLFPALDRLNTKRNDHHSN